MIELSTKRLELRDVVAVARQDAEVVLSDEARRAMAESATIVQRLADSDEPVYGVSTGFGSLATTPIPAKRRTELQRALLRSHAGGMGPPVEREVVRAMMLLRARTLAMGYSGTRPEVAEAILAMLNAGLTPVVPEHGSLGASGDLAPLAHCGLALIGEGEVFARRSERLATAEALAARGMEPLTLTAKEGLALINGTDGMLGMLALAINDLGLIALWRPGDPEAELELVGLALDFCHTRLAVGEEAEWIARRLARACPALGAAVERTAEQRFRATPRDPPRA